MTEPTPPVTPPADDPASAPKTRRGTGELAALRAENARLRQQLISSGQQPAGAAQTQHRFALTEGDRQELELYGVATIGGRLMTVDDARTAAEEAGLEVTIGDPSEALDRRAQVATEQGERTAVRGFDYVYPSVAPGQIDPKVAGMPGINGPAADGK
jgi:hypothetical protein